MNELVKVTETEQGNQAVSGRELHAFLEVQSNYTTWFDRMCEYGFAENVDYVKWIPDLESGLNGGQIWTGYAVTFFWVIGVSHFWIIADKTFRHFRGKVICSRFFSFFDSVLWSPALLRFSSCLWSGGSPPWLLTSTGGFSFIVALFRFAFPLG